MIHDLIKQKVIIPSGKCPVSLESSDEDSVLEWLSKIEESSSTKKYLSTAYRYWVRQIFYGEPEKIDEALKVIDENLDSLTVFQEMKKQR